MNTSLKKYIEDGNNIYDIIGKSKNKIPDDKKKIYSIIAKYVKNPTKIFFINMSVVYSALKNIDGLKNKKVKPFFTSCIFCLSGKRCGNHTKNRFISVEFKYETTTIKLDICYPDISKCRTRVTFGFHIDFDFTYDGRRLKITGGKKFVQTPRKSRCKTSTRLKKIANKQPEPVFDTANFPDLSINPNNKNTSEDSTWTTVGNDAKLLAQINETREATKQSMINDQLPEVDKKIIEEERQKLIVLVEDLKKEQSTKQDRIKLLETTLQERRSKRRAFDNPEYFDDDFSGNYFIR